MLRYSGTGWSTTKVDLSLIICLFLEIGRRGEDRYYLGSMFGIRALFSGNSHMLLLSAPVVLAENA